MDGKELAKVLKFVFVASGVPKSSFFARWSVFAYPFWQSPGKQQVGFKVMAYRGTSSSNERIAKMCLDHGLTCLTAGLGVGTSGLGSIGSGLETAGGKFGGLKSAFGVDIGAVQLTTVLESKSSSPLDVSNAIINSGRTLLYAIVRVDQSGSGYTLHFRHDNRPNSYTEWGVTHIDRLEDSSVMYSVYPTGLVLRGAKIVGNYKTGKKA